MNIQIFGKNKCFDTKKAQRWFKERGIKFQMIDLTQKGMSRGELDSVLKAVGGLDAVLDEKSKGYASLTYLAYDEDKKEKLLDDGTLLKTPIVRNGKQATVGYQPDIWANWE
ncbi:arsenate reductase family protein [Candidatus Agathobaculum pullicola]|uniref:arsenate reductase family protein n=1 Tax=Candidatus Agathobaculum pullicola TaxID=2838426 RepID=UPI003F8DF888